MSEDLLPPKKQSNITSKLAAIKDYFIGARHNSGHSSSEQNPSQKGRGANVAQADKKTAKNSPKVAAAKPQAKGSAKVLKTAKTPPKKAKEPASSQGTQAGVKKAPRIVMEENSEMSKQVKKAAADIKASTRKALKHAVGEITPKELTDAAFASYVSPPTNKAGEALCREAGCERLATTSHYCRSCYIRNWKKIKRKELILKEGKLNHYIEELVAKYPEKYLEAIRQDLSDDKEFNKVIHDLELDESSDEFAEDADSVDSLIGTIRRDMDDEGDAF